MDQDTQYGAEKTQPPQVYKVWYRAATDFMHFDQLALYHDDS